MSEPIQEFLLKYSKFLQKLVNEKLAVRSGIIGKIFNRLQIGKRQYSQHAFARLFKFSSHTILAAPYHFSQIKPVFARYFGTRNGILNYFNITLFLFIAMLFFPFLQIGDMREIYFTNMQDKPAYWYSKYMMAFPPSYLHERRSAHYIEISQIFFIEMLKKYMKVKYDILEERDKYSNYDKHTKYILNPNYVYEPLPEDCEETKMALKRLRLKV